MEIERGNSLDRQGQPREPMNSREKGQAMERQQARLWNTNYISLVLRIHLKKLLRLD